MESADQPAVSKGNVTKKKFRPPFVHEFLVMQVSAHRQVNIVGDF